MNVKETNANQGRLSIQVHPNLKPVRKTPLLPTLTVPAQQIGLEHSFQDHHNATTPDTSIIQLFQDHHNSTATDFTSNNLPRPFYH